MRWLTSFPGVIEVIYKVFILVILSMVGAVVVMGFVQSWRSNDITITSFTDTSPDTGVPKSGELGNFVTDLLESEIRRIAQFHTPTNPWGDPQEVPLLAMTSQQSIDRVEGTISFAGFALPLEEVVEAIQPVFAHTSSHYRIAGTLRRFPAENGSQVKESGGRTEEEDCHKFPSGDNSRVRIMVRLEENGRMIKHWTVRSRLTSNAEDDAEIPTHLAKCLREVAYEIMWTVLEGVEADSLDTFKNFIEGVDLFRQYKKSRGKNLEIFDRAVMILTKAIKKNQEYARAHFYLGNLYSWRAFYEDLGSDYEKKYEEDARREYKEVKTGYTHKPYEAMALSNFGEGLVALRHYKKLRKVMPSSAKDTDKHLEDAHKAFTAALKQAPEFYFARTGRAQVYKEIAESLKGSGEIAGKKDCLEHAIGEFQSAKKTASSLKDKDSLKWVEKQMGALQLQKQRIPARESGTSRPFTPCKTLSRS